MKQQKLWQGFFISAGIFLLILFRGTAAAGARSGIQLCLQTIIPTLLPFFFLNNLLVSYLEGRKLSALRLPARLCRMPENGEAYLIPAFLGGYPMGAAAISEGWQSGSLSRRDAERMLGFCSNAGPAFLLGILGPLFPELWMVWSLWAIHIASALLTGLLLPGTPGKAAPPEHKDLNAASAMNQAIHATAAVCAWIICFQLLTSCIQKYVAGNLSLNLQVLLAGLLELTSGCCLLSLIRSIPVRYILCAGMLGFGGLCVLMQTASVTEGLSLRWYLWGKAIQSLLSMLMAAVILSEFRTVLLLLSILLAVIVLTREKSSGISKAIAV